MKSTIFSLLLLGAGVAGNSFPVIGADIQVAPGHLGESLATIPPGTTLTIQGAADARDLSLLRSLEGVEILDLSATNIAAVATDTPLMTGRTQFEANHLPAYILFDAGFTKVILPQSLSAIESGALAGSSITEIVIPEGVTSIGDFAFYGCTDLRKVRLPSTLLTIGRGAFAECPALESINLEDSKVSTLPEECFAGDLSLRSINATGLLSIGSRSLARTGVERLDLPQVTRMEPFALADMYNLLILNVSPETAFSEGALMNCSALTSINGMPENIPDLFAANCSSLESASLLAGSAYVGRYALANSGASNLIFGQSLRSIDENALRGMTALNHIDAVALGDNPPQAAPDAFSGISPAKVRLKVADFTESIWQSHPIWGQFDIYSDHLTGVGNISSDATNDISVRLNGTILSIAAPEPIVAAAIYDAAGNLLMTLSCGTDSISADISELPQGIAVVGVRTSTMFKGYKIYL